MTATPLSATDNLSNRLLDEIDASALVELDVVIAYENVTI